MVLDFEGAPSTQGAIDEAVAAATSDPAVFNLLIRVAPNDYHQNAAMFANFVVYGSSTANGTTTLILRKSIKPSPDGQAPDMFTARDRVRETLERNFKGQGQHD